MNGRSIPRRSRTAWISSGVASTPTEEQRWIAGSEANDGERNDAHDQHDRNQGEQAAQDEDRHEGPRAKTV